MRVCMFILVCMFSCVLHACVYVSALQAALELAEQISSFPQQCLRADRSSALHSVYAAASLPAAMQYEAQQGAPVLRDEAVAGATSFTCGVGRGGRFT